MLTTNSVYGFTQREIEAVILIKIYGGPHAFVIMCSHCGRPILSISRDSGMGPQWFPAAQVLRRLHIRREVIDGALK